VFGQCCSCPPSFLECGGLTPLSLCVSFAFCTIAVEERRERKAQPKRRQATALQRAERDTTETGEHGVFGQTWLKTSSVLFGVRWLDAAFALRQLCILHDSCGGAERKKGTAKAASSHRTPKKHATPDLFPASARRLTAAGGTPPCTPRRSVLQTGRSRLGYASSLPARSAALREAQGNRRMSSLNLAASTNRKPEKPPRMPGGHL
jgi:hypothetical protein